MALIADDPEFMGATLDTVDTEKVEAEMAKLQKAIEDKMNRQDILAIAANVTAIVRGFVLPG